MTDPMPRRVPHFHEALEGLKERLLVMGGLAEERDRAAVQALVDRDPDLAEAVRTGDVPLNRLHVDIDQRCVALIALNPPVVLCAMFGFYALSGPVGWSWLKLRRRPREGAGPAGGG